MHRHEHDPEQPVEARPKTERETSAVPDHLLARAAAEGRTDVLGRAGLLRLQRTAGNAAAAAATEERSPVHDVVAGGGHPLDPEVRADMETRLGHDFGDVRLHTDGAAHDSAKAVNAHAYTVGSHVVFQRDAYDPGSPQGRTTLAHELTHVVQQRSGPVDGTETAGGIRVSDPSDRFEREAVANAERAMAQPASVPAVTPSGPAVQGLFVQRAAEEGAEEEPAVQGLFVQRASESEEEEAPA